MSKLKSKRGCLTCGCVVTSIILLIAIIVVIGLMTCSTDSTDDSSLAGALDNTSFEWSTGGNADWFPQTSTSYQGGGDAAQSGAISSYQSSWLGTEVTGPKTITFYWKLSGGTLDSLEFYIDGVQRKQLTGMVNWQQESYYIDSGEHDLKWIYTESAGPEVGSAWLDQVEITTPKDGTLYVKTNIDGINVYIDNEYYSSTNAIWWDPAFYTSFKEYSTSVHGLSVGEYTLKLSKSGYKEWTKEISISGGLTTTVYAYMEAGTGEATTMSETISADTSHSGQLRVIASPGTVQVYIDGEYYGGSGYLYWGDKNTHDTSPLLPEGTYTLKVTQVGYKEWTKEVSISGGLTTTVYTYLEKIDPSEPDIRTSTTRDETITADSKYGTLTLTSWNVGGFGIYISDEFGNYEYDGTVSVCQINTDSITYCATIRLVEGTYTLKLIKSGYEEWTQQINIVEGVTTGINAALVKS